MPNTDYQTGTPSARRHSNTRGIVDRSGWRCRVCGHINFNETEYCSKCGYRLGAQRYFR